MLTNVLHKKVFKYLNLEVAPCFHSCYTWYISNKGGDKMGTLKELGQLLINLDGLPETVERQQEVISSLEERVSSQSQTISQLTLTVETLFKQIQNLEDKLNDQINTESSSEVSVDLQKRQDSECTNETVSERVDLPGEGDCETRGEDFLSEDLLGDPEFEDTGASERLDRRKRIEQRTNECFDECAETIGRAIGESTEAIGRAIDEYQEEVLTAVGKYIGSVGQSRDSFGAHTTTVDVEAREFSENETLTPEYFVALSPAGRSENTVVDVRVEHPTGKPNTSGKRTPNLKTKKRRRRKKGFGK